MLLIDIALFIAVVILTGIVYPVMGYRQSKKRGKTSSIREKSKWYLSSIISGWIPALVIATVLLLNGHTLKDTGFAFISPEIKGALFYIALALSAIYLIYNIYTIILLRFNKKIREQQSKEIPDEYRFILPTTKREKGLWRLLAVTAGVTEEFIYRGYLFFALFLLFPGIHPIIVIAISSIIFSVGHLYQGREVWKPAAAGLFLSIVYFFIGSIYLVIVLHIIQDLVAGELDPENSSDNLSVDKLSTITASIAGPSEATESEEPGPTESATVAIDTILSDSDNIESDPGNTTATANDQTESK